jgi:hypothetical protein
MLHTSSGISSCVSTRANITSYHHSRPSKSVHYGWYSLTSPRLRLCQYVQPPYHKCRSRAAEPSRSHTLLTTYTDRVPTMTGSVKRSRCSIQRTKMITKWAPAINKHVTWHPTIPSVRIASTSALYLEPACFCHPRRDLEQQFRSSSIRARSLNRLDLSVDPLQ